MYISLDFARRSTSFVTRGFRKIKAATVPCAHEPLNFRNVSGWKRRLTKTANGAIFRCNVVVNVEQIVPTSRHTHVLKAIN